jgi:uncharacterized small protein (DUF1192 family)
MSDWPADARERIIALEAEIERLQAENDELRKLVVHLELARRGLKG